MCGPIRAAAHRRRGPIGCAADVATAQDYAATVAAVPELLPTLVAWAARDAADVGAERVVPAAFAALAALSRCGTHAAPVPPPVQAQAAADR